jgi:hypothetical protein
MLERRGKQRRGKENGGGKRVSRRWALGTREEKYRTRRRGEERRDAEEE